MEDERQVELDCISAIFPEIVLDPERPFNAAIELPINPRNPVKVYFPASADGAIQTPFPTPPHSAASGQEEGQATVTITNDIESHNLSYLPSLRLLITLPGGYPATCAPKFELSTAPPWLSRNYLDGLESNGNQMWEEAGRTEIIFGYIDSLQQEAENAFGYGEGKVLEIPQDYKIALLDYDIKATQAAFERETFDCGVCLDPKKGSVCHKMIDCGHVFCVQCLQDFYNNAINEGDLVSVRCLAPDCAKKRADSQSAKHRKPKTQLSPSELLQIPIEHELVTRYVKLKHKAELESDKNTVYCPRKWCQGAARSKKHKKPKGFEIVESDDESDAEEKENGSKFQAGNDLLAVCEDCSFAFCSRCYQGWHGEFTLCAPKPNGELTEEDKASLEYLKLHTTPCPTCAAPAQKTHGCNHMICFKCNSHFCYLCSAWLEPSNPYKHYNMETTGCYMRLWELEAGDGDDVGIGFGGGVAEQPEAEEIEIPEEEELNLGDLADEVIRRLQNAGPGQREELEDAFALALGGGPEAREAFAAVPHGEPIAPAQQELQREGPLVLRINAAPPPPPPAAPAVPDAPQPGRRNGHPRRGNLNHRIDPRLAGIRAAAPMGGVRRAQPARAGRRQEARADARVGAAPQAHGQEQEAAHQAWVQRFVELALNDQEDQLDSDDEEDAAAWEIPVR
ncbi:RING-type E3 ubiquitin transferase itt1 [Hyphodiscus hymeniophilus]|uniref:RBR-type E3 ubiquitin transferase n=1 Tax=Hyphodiscus hymeniophilus TaxID=353542 RepID=A0A9P7AW18_9HELO|nr:RING-type E3 ubiquitin transferase itt1 [Hyphodiscus hymeniophilus]